MCRNQGWALMRTEVPVLNEEIYCWMYTINPSKRHLLMAMRVRSGKFAMCMARDLLERRECVSESSGENPSLAAPTRLHFSLRTVMWWRR